MENKVTFQGAALHLLLVGGYAFWAKPSQNQKIGLASLAFFQSTQFYVKDYYNENREGIQFVYDIVPFAAFALMKAHVVATAVMGLLFMSISRFVMPLEKKAPPLPPPPGIGGRKGGARPTGPTPRTSEEWREEGQRIFIDFYSSQCPNTHGITIDQIWSYSDGTRESQHNFIQWIFPTWSVSGSNARAPTLNLDIVRAFRTTPELQARLRHSFIYMLEHYGLELTEDDKVQKTAQFNGKKHRMGGHDHNRLRITRIIASLQSLGQRDLAQSFFLCLDEINREDPSIFNQQSFGAWRNAASQ